MRLELEPASDTVIVSFGGLMGRRPILEGGRFFAGWDIKHILVRDLDGVWYQNGIRGLGRNVPEAAAVIRGVVERSGASRVIATGASAGGFGALLFGALIGADLTLTFSPQTTVSPDGRDELGDHRWATSADRIRALCDGPLDHADVVPVIAARTQPNPVVVHFSADDELDARHAERLRDLPGVELVSHETGGHALTRRLRARGTYDDIVIEAMGLRPDQRIPSTATKPGRALRPEQVDAVVFGPAGAEGVAETVADVAAHGVANVAVVAAAPLPDAPAESSVVRDQHESFLGLHLALAEQLTAGAAPAVLVLHAGVVLPEGALEAMLRRNRSEAVVTVAPTVEGERRVPPPRKLPSLLAAPFTPAGLLVDRVKLEAVGGIDGDLGPLALWDVMIRLAGLTPDRPLSTWDRATATGAAPADHEDHLRGFLERRGYAPELAAAMAEDMRRYDRNTFWEVLLRNQDLVSRFAVEALMDAEEQRAGLNRALQRRRRRK